MLPNALFLNVHMYGVMIAVGLLCAFAVLYLYGKKKKISSGTLDFFFYNGILTIAFGFLSASLFQSLYNYIAHPENGFRFFQGITFIGGLIGGAAFFLLGCWIFRKKLKEKLSDVISLLPCCIVVGHAFGRIGCFFAGCCYGLPATGFWSFLGVSFAPGSDAYAEFGATPLHPTQLYEAGFLFLLFAVMSLLYLKKNFRHNLSLYLIGYGVVRFLLEFVRNDSRGQFLGILSPSQFWSIVLVLIGVGLIFFDIFYIQKKNRQKEPENISLPEESGNKEEL